MAPLSTATGASLSWSQAAASTHVSIELSIARTLVVIATSEISAALVARHQAMANLVTHILLQGPCNRTQNASLT